MRGEERAAYRPSSPAASCVIKIKAVVMGYSFWPLTVGIHLTGSGGRQGGLEPVRERQEIKIRGGIGAGWPPAAQKEERGGGSVVAGSGARGVGGSCQEQARKHPVCVCTHTPMMDNSRTKPPTTIDS